MYYAKRFRNNGTYEKNKTCKGFEIMEHLKSQHLTKLKFGSAAFRRNRACCAAVLCLPVALETETGSACALLSAVWQVTPLTKAPLQHLT